MGFAEEATKYKDPEIMARDFLLDYFGDSRIEFPVNPFSILRDEGILFKMSDFNRLEGVYIPASSDEDVPVVGINANVPITRQRYTAVHELCHHFHDAGSGSEISCPIGGKKSAMEKFAEGFAAAVLMPMPHLICEVNKRKGSDGFIDFDGVLEIADYFGVSFQACAFRIAYRIHAISGNTEPDELKRRIREYGPDRARRKRHMNYERLYAGLIDSYREQLAFSPTDHARLLFQNEYIFNDCRMEGVNVTIDEASEIVTDIRLNMQNSVFCNESNEAYLSIAGHYDMYQDIFSEPVRDSVSVFDTFGMNKKLFSHYPCPEYGGNVRQNNTLVLGAGFESVDYHDIYDELLKLDSDVKDCYTRRDAMSTSEFIRHVVRTHHRLTVVHPFPDGNGRTSRAFMNMQFVRAGLTPVYIRLEDKDEYVRALEYADRTSDFGELYEVVFRLMIRCHVELCA